MVTINTLSYEQMSELWKNELRIIPPFVIVQTWVHQIQAENNKPQSTPGNLVQVCNLHQIHNQPSAIIDVKLVKEAVRKVGDGVMSLRRGVSRYIPAKDLSAETAAGIVSANWPRESLFLIS